MGALIALILLIVLPAFSYQPLPLLIETGNVGAFDDAAGMTVLPQGWICVVDRGGNSLHLLKNMTAPPTVIGGYGWQSSAFDRPSAVSTDGISLFVADYGNHRVQRFDRNLSFISALATRDTTDPRARFGYPLGVAVSRFGDLFVLDGENLRVAKFHVSGRFERSFGDAERATGRLVAPVGLTLGGNDRLVVVERNRILEYDYFGNFLRRVDDGTLNDIVSVTPYDSGYAVLTDGALLFFHAGGRVHRLSLAAIVTEKPISDVRAVVVQRSTLWLLTKKECRVFEVRWR